MSRTFVSEKDKLGEYVICLIITVLYTRARCSFDFVTLHKELLGARYASTKLAKDMRRYIFPPCDKK